MTEQLSEKEANKEAIKVRTAEIEAEETKLNEGKTGKGTRTMVGLTRGRNPQKIYYEAFDTTQPATLPVDLTEFMKLAGLDSFDGAKAEKRLVEFGIDGFNSWSYTQASDPVAEFVDVSWPEDIQAKFRLAVRNYAGATGLSIEDAAKLIKPGIAAAQLKAAEKTPEKTPETVSV